MNGFFLIDKPKGVTSFSLVRDLRKLLGIRKIGYAGTLDPLATGLMVVAVGEATKLLHDLEGLDKIYDVTVHFGFISATYDAEGPLQKVVAEDGLRENIAPENLKRSTIEQIFEEHFLGERMQKPPIYSAIKVGGKRAYQFAREGETVELKLRKVTFYDIKMKRFAYPLLECSVHCSSGTYIRSFAHDLGQILGTGGYVEELRRTKVGQFFIKNAVNFSALNPLNFREFLIKPEELLNDWQRYFLNDQEHKILAQGGFIVDRISHVSGHDINVLEAEKIKTFSPPILAMFQDICVGILEYTADGRLKFAKKFNIV